MTHVPEGNGFPLAKAVGNGDSGDPRRGATPKAPMPKRFPPPTTDSIAGPVEKSAVVQASGTQTDGDAPNGQRYIARQVPTDLPNDSQSPTQSVRQGSVHATDPLWSNQHRMVSRCLPPREHRTADRRMERQTRILAPRQTTATRSRRRPGRRYRPVPTIRRRTCLRRGQPNPYAPPQPVYTPSQPQPYAGQTTVLATGTGRFATGYPRRLEHAVDRRQHFRAGNTARCRTGSPFVHANGPRSGLGHPRIPGANRANHDRRCRQTVTPASPGKSPSMNEISTSPVGRVRSKTCSAARRSVAREKHSGLEAAPGSDFQRYTINYAQPNLLRYLPFSFSISGFLYDRRFTDWDENRLGARMSLGYRITPDLSLAVWN